MVQMLQIYKYLHFVTVTVERKMKKEKGMSFFFIPFPENKDNKENSEQV